MSECWSFFQKLRRTPAVIHYGHHGHHHDYDQNQHYYNGDNNVTIMILYRHYTGHLMWMRVSHTMTNLCQSNITTKPCTCWWHINSTLAQCVVFAVMIAFWSTDQKGGGPRVVVSTAAFHARVRGSVPGLGGFKETKMFLPHPRVKVSIVGSLRDREVACSASDRQGSNFESCVWRTVSSQSSRHPQEVLLAQFSLYVHKSGLKPDSLHFYRSETRDIVM